MLNYLNKSKLNSNTFSLILIFFFSFLINFFYSQIGVYPIDTFLHYDHGYKILNNQYPVKDYWIVTGFIVDFLQSFFFKIFGINWTAYIIHSSVFNAFISIITYFFLLSLRINRFYALIYTLCFSTLAYTISGTPFVDLHSTFFLLLATYCIYFAIKDPSKKYLWFLFILFFFLSFLSKQVPTSYAVILQGVILMVYFWKEKKSKIFKFIIITSCFLLILLISILLILEINISNFYTQYILFPSSIGLNRYDLFDKSFETFFNQYKFILIPLFIIIYLKLVKILKNKGSILSTENYQFLIIFAFIICLIFHQLMTKNQIFIYFTIPLILGILTRELSDLNLKYLKFLTITLLLLSVLVTIKYHLRFNESRKFHELSNVNLNNFVKSENLDKSLKGLKWTNSLFNNSPTEEIILLKKGLEILKVKDEPIMLITNYSFFESILKKKLFSPARAFTADGTTIPLKQNKFYKDFKIFFDNILKKNNIKKIYFLKHENISHRIIKDYLPNKCYETDIHSVFKIYNIKC